MDLILLQKGVNNLKLFYAATVMKQNKRQIVQIAVTPFTATD